MKAQMGHLFGTRRTEQEGEHWMTISDLMAGLMMVFLFISIALMRTAFLERDKIKEVAVAYRDGQVAINRALWKEFESDLPKWEAELDAETLAIEFKSPEVLFETGEIALQPRFVEILNDFFPRYLAVIKQFETAIEEVRIEGHTSSDWDAATGEAEAYFKNMWLSQGRTRSVLEYVYNLPTVTEDRMWVKANLAAVGFSFSRLVVDEAGREDRDASRRVVFRIVTNAEYQIRKILTE